MLTLTLSVPAPSVGMTAADGEILRLRHLPEVKTDHQTIETDRISWDLHTFSGNFSADRVNLDQVNFESASFAS